MMTTENCIYKTPCGWCSKWDKECDKKISYPRGKRAELGVYDDACNHDWLYLGEDTPTAGYVCANFKCRKCGHKMTLWRK